MTDGTLKPMLAVHPDTGGMYLRRETSNVQIESELSCPHCGHRRTERMPENYCQYYYDCHGCGALLHPRSGDCCVYCSYGSVPCPPVQQEQTCCTPTQPK